MTVNLQVGTGTVLNRVPFEVARVVVDMGTASILSRTPMDAVQSVPWWVEDPDSWEAVWLDGARLPGVSFITGQVGLRHKRRRAAGVHGDNPVQFGYEAAKLSIELVLWTKEHLAAWSKQLQRLRPRAARGQPPGVSISHPATTMLGINFVEVIHVSLLKCESPGMDIFSTQLELLEHIPQPTANKAKVRNTDLTTVPHQYATGAARKTPPTPTSQTAVRPSQTNGGP